MTVSRLEPSKTKAFPAPSPATPTAHRRATRSRFAAALTALLDNTGIYDRRQWASFLDVTVSAISQWVRDKTLPSAERLRKILDYLRDQDEMPEEILLEFGEVCFAPAQQVSPLGSRLGDNATFGDYLLQPLRTALQRTLSTLPVAKQEEVLVSANGSAREALLGRIKRPLVPREHVFQALLTEARKRLAADSLCFYVADSLLDGDCRLALQEGVRYPEALQGPNFPLKSRALKPIGNYAFFKDAKSALPLRQETDKGLRPLIDRNPLFGDFIDRERVASCARIEVADGDKVSSVLFVNYSSQPEHPEQLKEPITQLFEQLNAEALPYFNALYGREQWGEELHKLPIALQRFLANTKRSVVSALEGGLEDILERVLAVLDLDRSNTLGTIHIYEKSSGTLLPAAKKGPELKEFPLLRTVDGTGLITWAALRRRAIMVNDLQASEFRTIYHPIRNETRSELALPMFAGDDVVAVLNIESSRVGVFDPHVVRTLALASSQIAIMWQNFMLGKQIWTLNQLLIAVDQGLQESLTRIAELARQYVDCVSTDVWRFKQDTRKFDMHGGKVNDAGGGPRSHGWSYYLATQGRPVFLSDIQSCKDFNALEWDGSEWRPAAAAAPTELNPVSVRRGIRAHLGLPIRHGDKCFGVLWIKFGESSSLGHLPPPATEMRAFEEGLVGPAGQIIMRSERAA